MPFDWRDFLDLAKELHQRGSSERLHEASQRTVVSRAYYAVFCFLREYAINHQNFVATKSSEDHSQLRKHLQTLGEPWDEIADKMDELRKWRNLCDYEPAIKNTQQLAKLALQYAQDILKSLGSL